MTKLSDPLTFARGPAMPNRLMLAPLTNVQSNADGTLHDDEFHWLTMRSKGGFGLTMTCAAHVQQQGNAFPGQLGICSDVQLPGLRRLSDAIRAEGSRSSVQLHHGGERSDSALSGMDVVCPWNNPKFNARAMTTDEVEQSIAAFIAAAVRAEQAGFDGVELHGAHGYLLCSFLSQKNQRDDGYGGTYENRTRIIWEIAKGIRDATKPDFQLGIRLTAERMGITLPEAQRFAGEVMVSDLFDYLDMSLWDCFKEPADEEFHFSNGGKPLIEYFTSLPRSNCRLGVAGAILSAKTAQQCLDAGADFVIIGKGAMLHHDFAERAIADSEFATVPFPQPESYYAKEGLSPKFIAYVKMQWPQYVSS